MKIFITGASGFVGKATTQMLVTAGHTIGAMSRSEETDTSIIESGATPVRSALNTITTAQLQNFDIVIHAAAMVSSWGKRKDFWDTNVEGTRHLLAISKKAGIRKLIHISTEAVLWNGKDIIDADESYPYSTSSSFLYGETKREAEKSVLAANIPGEFETVVLRPRLVWGPEDKTIFPAAISMYEKGKFIWINGGKAKTSSTHIFNLLEGIRLAIEKGKGGEVYFITDNEVSTLQSFFTALFATKGIHLKAGSLPGWLVKTIASLLESFYKIGSIEKPPPITMTAACLMSCECTLRNDKATREMGYRPVISLEEGMKQLMHSVHPANTIQVNS